jgi:predicted nucleotidyltransferase
VAKKQFIEIVVFYSYARNEIPPASKVNITTENEIDPKSLINSIM